MPLSPLTTEYRAFCLAGIIMPSPAKFPANEADSDDLAVARAKGSLIFDLLPAGVSQSELGRSARCLEPGATIASDRVGANLSKISFFYFEFPGAPEGIRTPDLCLRRAALYPAELRARRTTT